MQEAARLAQAANVPVWFEPTSPPKSIRAVPVLQNMAYISPNSNELIAMANGLRAAEGLPPLPGPQPTSAQPQDPLPETDRRSSSRSNGHQHAAFNRLQSLLPHIRTLLEVLVAPFVFTLPFRCVLQVLVTHA